MHIEQHVKLWNMASVKIWDVRHVVMQADEEVNAYRLPTSGFLYTLRGNASIRLDQTIYEIQNMQVLHAGKGVWVNISVKEKSSFEYILILYRANLALPYTRETRMMLEQHTPFHVQYRFTPQYPIDLYDKIQRIERCWERTDALAKFQVKTLFYQFVHELLKQFDIQGIQVAQQTSQYVQKVV